jgi:gamma-glutamyltranspeptidase/glutathione hydrolase
MRKINRETGFLLEQGELDLPSTGRPVVYAMNGVVSSGHYLTSMSGMRMLISGGNAFDALVASTFAAAVVEPIASYSIGAEATFMIFHAQSGNFVSLSGQGNAVSGANPKIFKEKGFDSIPTGPGLAAPMSFTVPGVVAACFSMLDKYGTKSPQEVLAPSIEYAERGIPNYEYMISRLGAGGSMEQFDLFPPGGREIFFDNGELPKPGSLLVQKSLGRVFRLMASSADAAGGDRKSEILAARQAFYSGVIADEIESEVAKLGGILNKGDLESYKESYSEPVTTTYMGFEIHGHSTWTQGPVLNQALNILENFDLKSMGHNSVEYVHTVTEALKLAFSDREAFYGDPDFAVVPLDGLLSKEYAIQRSKLIDVDNAIQHLPAYGNPWDYSSKDGIVSSQPSMGSHETNNEKIESGTTHITVMDKDGNIGCATPSGGAFNKSVFFSKLGFGLSTRSEMFNFTDGHPNVLEPGKRPRTTIINYMIAKDGVPIATVGCPGGDAQPQANLQLILNTILWEMNPQEAVESPRFSSLSVPNSFYPHTYLPGQLAIENGFSNDVQKGLAAKGHHIVSSITCGMGATVAVRNPMNGVLAAGADPRRACYAIGF